MKLYILEVQLGLLSFTTRGHHWQDIPVSGHITGNCTNEIYILTAAFLLPLSCNANEEPVAKKERGDTKESKIPQCRKHGELSPV